MSTRPRSRRAAGALETSAFGHGPSLGLQSDRRGRECTQTDIDLVICTHPNRIGYADRGIAEESANMDRDVFLDHLLRASAHCREFTTRLVFDSLPGTYAYWVLLNCSYDGHPLKDGEVVFPDDVQRHGKRVGPLRADAVASLLWRDHMVPE